MRKELSYCKLFIHLFLICYTSSEDSEKLQISRSMTLTSRVIARIRQIHLQNSKIKSALPDLATKLLYMLIPTKFKRQLRQKGHFTDDS